MAPRLWNDFVALVCAHPVLAGVSLIIFTPPFFPILKFFSPLLISTALFMLALFTMGPKSGGSGEGDEGVEEMDGVGEREGDDGGVRKQRGADGGWMDWVRSIEESSLSFMSPRAKLKNWKGGESVSVLDDASWAKGADFTSYAQGDSGFSEEEAASRRFQESVGNAFMPALIAPSNLFKVDSQLTAGVDGSIYGNTNLGEDGPDDNAPELEDVDEPAPNPATARPSTESMNSHSGVHHPPMERLRISNRLPSAPSKSESPTTDLDSSSDFEGSKRFMDANGKKSANSLNANAADSPVVDKLSLSGKLHQMEKLADFIEDPGTADNKAGETKMLQPTTDEQVEAVKDHLESFVQEEKPKEADTDSVPSSASSKPGSVGGDHKGEISEAKK